MRKRARERQEKREDRPISKRLRATLLRSFKGLHGKKMVCVRGVRGITGTLGKANSHFDQYVSESIRVLRTNRKSVVMIRVKVNSKSELAEDREGKSALNCVIYCCDDRLLSRAVICGHTV